MNNQKLQHEIADLLFEELNSLVKYWLDYFKQKGEDTLHSFDGGVSIEYVNVYILKDAYNILYALYKKKPISDLEEQINFVNHEFNKLFDLYSEFFEWSPNEINEIAYLMRACFKNRDSLFITLDQEKLFFFLESTQKDKTNYLLWKELNDKK